MHSNSCTKEQRTLQFCVILVLKYILIFYFAECVNRKLGVYDKSNYPFFCFPDFFFFVHLLKTSPRKYLVITFFVKTCITHWFTFITTIAVKKLLTEKFEFIKIILEPLWSVRRETKRK